LIHVIIAVSAGRLLTLLPHRLLEAVIALLFFGGSMLLFFGKHGLESEPDKKAPTKEASHSFLKVYSTAFGVTFLGEWGDITQITTANYAARYHNPWSVAIGALFALWTVSALAVIFGRKALLLISPHLLQRITALILLGFAIVSLVSAIKA
jgi:putative Ca2+/H+ antiporter (TMEM165/GDT1 family)